MEEKMALQRQQCFQVLLPPGRKTWDSLLSHPEVLGNEVPIVPKINPFTKKPWVLPVCSTSLLKNTVGKV